MYKEIKSNNINLQTTKLTFRYLYHNKYLISWAAQVNRESV